MMRHLLVVSPRMPPYNGADAQRARIMLPHLARHGWRATVVAASETSEAGSYDRELLDTLPTDTEIVRVSAWPGARWKVGLRQHALRAYWPTRRVVDDLLKRQRLDAAFVSHTDFPLWPLSLHWSLPVVLDWQDPWRSDYYDARSAPPPGGRWRFAAMQALARRYEPRVARHAVAHVVVSAAYAEGLRSRYPDLASRPFLELPFAAARADLERARRRPADGLPSGKRRWWVYAGRGGPDLAPALHAFFEALAQARLRQPHRYADLGLLFQGTSYDPRDVDRVIARLARTHAVEDMVVEKTERIGLLETYRLLDAAEALIVPGSDDPAYMASKLAPYLLTGRPVLGLFHARSPAHRLASAHGAVRFVAFEGTDAASRKRLVDDLTRVWFDPALPPPSKDVALGLCEAAAMTERLCALFDEAVGASR